MGRMLSAVRAGMLVIALMIVGVSNPLGLTWHSAQAQTTAYVTDALEITMRSGQGNDFRIIRLLTSGTQVEVLERGDDWTRVQIGNSQGWVRSLYLQAQPGAVERLEQATERLQSLREDNRRLSESLAQAESARDELIANQTELEADNQRMQQRLQAADEGLALADENQTLRKQVIDLERQVQDLTRETEQNSRQGRQSWFIAGAGVVVFGMLFGILMTRIRWRRRSSWSDL